MDESNAPQNRRTRRKNVFLAATIEYAGQERSVKLRNLSAEGALIEADALPVEGSEVLFRRKELSVQGRVAWIQGQHAGLSFAEPLDAQTVLRHIPAPKPKSHFRPDYRRPGLACREMSENERKFAERWAVTSPLGSLGE